MPFYSQTQLLATNAAPGVRRRSVYLDNLMLTFFEFDTGAVVPMHDHPHEQITYVVEGALEFTLGDETRLLRAGDGAAVPPGVGHGAVAKEPTRVLDGWHPPREDYK